MPNKDLISKKRKFIEILKTSKVDRPKPSEIIKELCISETTYYRWLKNKELLNIAAKENKQDTDAFLPDILDMLINKALQGDMNAIKFFIQKYDIKGETDDDEVLTADRIIEIVQKAKKDAENRNTKN